MMWNDGPWNHSETWGGGWLMTIGILLALTAGVVLVVLLVKQLSGPVAAAGPEESSEPDWSEAGSAAAHSATARLETPREIVQRRYASGEIDRTEYLQKIQDL